MACKLCVVVVCLVLGVSVSALQQFTKYKYFDEYLLHLDHRQQVIIAEKMEIKITSLIRTGVIRSKEEQCCMLGQMAGDKGYRCYSRFYAARIISRNYNRVHNKKIPELLKGKRDPTADKLMRAFGQCVSNRGNIFHKCCRYTTLQTT